ncbi:MAG: hypothetical protein FJ206_14295 [Gemmatimonadetes bacterium]|nr:hypothetical protein [Gemmatimonadota bacterium]
MVRQTAGLGLALTAAAGALGWALWGHSGARAALMFGAIATGLQLGAAALMTKALAAGDYRALMPRWALGSLIRLVGIVAIPIAVAIDRTKFPPLGAALGYLAVTIPLLFFETRRFR